MTGTHVDPFSLDWEKDKKGNLIKDPDGNYLIKFKLDMVERPVVNSWGGVTKMFQIHEGQCNVAAVTAGLANFNNRTMASLADEFLRKQNTRATRRVSVLAVVKDFLRFMRSEYQSHYKGDSRPDDFKDGPEFLVGGYGRDDAHPSLFKVDVKNNKILNHYGPKETSKTGIAWGGQGSSVERIIRGYDGFLKYQVTEQMNQYHKEMGDGVIKIVSEVLTQLGAKFPKGVNTKLPKPLPQRIDWESYHLGIDYGNMPLQDAIDFVSFLVNLQSGRDKFIKGVATVGGRTHIGVISKASGFKMINEPEIVHKHTGFGDDGL